MAKAASPIRFQQDLMQAAESTAKRFHRSTAEQIEYWAELGRSVSSTLDPDILLSIKAGLAKIACGASGWSAGRSRGGYQRAGRSAGRSGLASWSE